MKDLDPQSQAIIDFIYRAGVLPFTQWEPEEARRRLLGLRAERPSTPEYEMYKVSEETIHTADGSFIVRILEPRAKSEQERMPVVLYYHGGGFFAGGLDETDLIVRQIAKQSDVVVINVNYHHSPEFRFPVAVNDAYAALCWTVEQAERLGIDPANIVLAGDSAGGNLTIVTCMQARDRGGPPIKFQVPIYPSLDLSEDAHYPSREQWGGGKYFLIGSDIDWMLSHYFTNRSEGRDWRASPMFASSFANLPPALVVTASHDPLMDEGKIYADRLSQSGVPVEYACFDGTFHGFVSFAIVLDVGKRGMQLICDRIKQSVSTKATE